MTAAAAYRAAARIADLRTGLTFNYARRRGVDHVEILTPTKAPDWMRNREKLWNAVEAFERRKDAQLAREIQLALPHELPQPARIALVRSFVEAEFVSRGMVADVAHHAAHRFGDDRNVHAHVLLTLRRVAGESFGQKERDWNAKDLLIHWRKQWAEAVNRALKCAGSVSCVDHRSLNAQRGEAERTVAAAQACGANAEAERMMQQVLVLDREPEPKLGASASALERRGIETARGALHRTTLERNAQRVHLRAVSLDITIQISNIAQRLQGLIDAGRVRLAEVWKRFEFTTGHAAQKPILGHQVEHDPNAATRSSRRKSRSRGVRPPSRRRP